MHNTGWASAANARASLTGTTPPVAVVATPAAASSSARLRVITIVAASPRLDGRPPEARALRHNAASAS